MVKRMVISTCILTVLVLSIGVWLCYIKGETIGIWFIIVGIVSILAISLARIKSPADKQSKAAKTKA